MQWIEDSDHKEGGHTVHKVIKATFTYIILTSITTNDIIIQLQVYFDKPLRILKSYLAQ